MNYDLMTWIEYFIGAFVGFIWLYFAAKIILKKSSKHSILRDIILMIILTFFTIANSLIFTDNIVKVVGTLVVFFCVYYFIYDERFNKAFTLTIFTFIIMVLGEATFALLASLINMIFKINLMGEVLTKSYYVNVVIAIFCIIYSLIFSKPIRRLINSIKGNTLFFVSILGIIMVLIGFSVIYNLFTSELVLDYKFILNIFIIVGCSILTLILLKQHLKNKEISDKYLLLEEYLKTSAELIEKYNSTIHKYKNNLISLKGYMKSDNEKANKYLDSLLDNYKTKKYTWLSQTNYINIDTLKYLIYYKLSKAEELNLKIIVNVSKEIEKIGNDIFKINELGIILDVLGEYFDNAIYASNESEEKELIFDLYLENNKIVFTISNTYKGSIDLSIISKNGYTTKGKGHGFGLYDVEKIIKINKNIDYEYKTIDNYFIVSLFVELEKFK